MLRTPPHACSECDQPCCKNRIGFVGRFILAAAARTGSAHAPNGFVRDANADLLAGFSVGGDDYITKKN